MSRKATKVAIMLVIQILLLSFSNCWAESVSDNTTENDAVYSCGDFEYVLHDDGSAELVGYTGQGGEIVIPNELNGHPIMAVQGNPFHNLGYGTYSVGVHKDHPYLATIDGVLFGKADRKVICFPNSLRITDYTVPEGIQHIGDYAFYWCGGLQRITLPSSLLSIGDYAFWGCHGLRSVSIPDGVNLIGEKAFAWSNQLSTVSIPDTVTSIGEGVFCNSTKLESVIISDSQPCLIFLDGVLFTRTQDCLLWFPPNRQVSEYSVPDSVVRIGIGAFCESDLQSIIIPESVSSIGAEAFYGCGRLTDLVIPNGVSRLEEKTFWYCSRLRRVSLPASLVSIEYQAFYSCRDLREIELPDTLLSIGEEAFSNCWALNSITIPDAVSFIAEHAFSDCPNLSIRVIADSYAESYCIANRLNYSVVDQSIGDAPTDWLD